MSLNQNWKSENYRGMHVRVIAMSHGKDRGNWDYAVRVLDTALERGDVPGAIGALATGPGSGACGSEEAAIKAGFAEGYLLVDRLKS